MQADYSWTLDPGPVLLVGTLAALYLPRWRRVRRDDGARAAPGWRLASYLSGLATLVVALISPIDRLAEQAFVFHMVQHVLLLDVAPILLVLGLTKVLLRPATRRLQAVERSAGVLAHPAAAVIAYTLAMWAWHVPGAYDAALAQPLVHVLEHSVFIGAGALYWWQLLSPIRSRFHSGAMGPLLYMVSTKVGVGLLGIALTFAPSALYAYQDRPGILGLDAVDDQQLGGELMTIEQMIVMGIALVFLLSRAIDESERAEQRRERLEDQEEQRAAAGG